MHQGKMDIVAYAWITRSILKSYPRQKKSHVADANVGIPWTLILKHQEKVWSNRSNTN